ncbi:MAG: AAA family ATPase [Rhodobiaceae bacterium]|nr:AAA family ATPase [Rhodobiaceae bacterium]
MTRPQRFILSGCSGGGKSTLLSELRRRGFQTFEEPGRQIVREEQASGGKALPWVNPEAFAAKAIEISVASFDAAEVPGPVFYDRSFIDAISYVSHLEGEVRREHRRLIETKRYTDQVFLTPPWPEIFQNDSERQTGFDRAVEEYERLLVSFAEFGYEPVILPKRPVEERVTFLLERISEKGSSP